VLGEEEALALFEKYGVMSRRETLSRLDVYLEQYVMSVQVEAKLMIEMARTTIYPAAIRYQGELAATGANLKAVGYPFDTATLDKVSDLAGGLLQSVERLEEALAHESDDLGEEAHHMCSKVVPAMVTPCANMPTAWKR
jgi:glutamine synthetase